MTNVTMNNALADTVAVRLSVPTTSPSNTTSAVTSPKTSNTGGHKRARTPEATQQWPASVGKRPPRDMKRLDRITWYSIIRTAKWGDTPALFLSPSEDNTKINEVTKGAAGATKTKVDEGGFFKPPRNYFEFNFQVGDRVKLVTVGYSNSRNKVATDITVDTNGRYEPIPSLTSSLGSSSQGEGDNNNNNNKRARISTLQNGGLLGRIPLSAPSNLMGFSPSLAAAASSICNQSSKPASPSRSSFATPYLGGLSPASFSPNGSSSNNTVYALLAQHAMTQRRNAEELKMRLAIAKIRQQQQEQQQQQQQQQQRQQQRQQQQQIQRQQFQHSPPMNQNALQAALQSLKTQQLNSAIFNILKNTNGGAGSHTTTPPMMFSSRAGSPTIASQQQYQHQSNMTNGSHGAGFGF